MMIEAEFNSDVFAASSWLELNEQPKDNLLVVPLDFENTEKSNQNIINMLQVHSQTCSVLLMSAIHYVTS